MIYSMVPSGFSDPESFSKYPSGAIVKKLDSPLEVKRWWLYSEWDPKCQFSWGIRPSFSERDDLLPTILHTNIELIQSVFYDIRGKWALWGDLKEKARWKRVVVEKLDPNWFRRNVEILYPSEEDFEVSELNGLVLWKEPSEGTYRLVEGNHRVSTWLRPRPEQPPALPGILFIGKPAKQH